MTRDPHQAAAAEPVGATNAHRSAAADPVLVLGDPVVTFGGQGIVWDGAVLCQDGKIIEVGSRTTLEQRYPSVPQLGSSQQVVLPGLINGHFHSDFSLAARWLRYPIERGNVHVRDPGSDPEQLYWSTVFRGLCCLRAGQTTVLDFVYGSPDLESLGLPQILRAYADLGLRASVAIALRDRHHYVHGDDQSFLSTLPDHLVSGAKGHAGYVRSPERAFDAFMELRQDGFGEKERSRLLLAPDWTPSVSDELYRRAVEVSGGCDVGLTTHAAETQLEVLHSFRTHGISPVRRLHELGVLSKRTSCAHTTWTSPEDHDLLASSGAIAVVNPGSNLRMGAGLPPAVRMRAAGVKVGLGTDGMALHAEDLLGEACLAAYLDRRFGVVDDEPADPLTLLADAQEAGAMATGFGDQIGQLRPGAAADLVVLAPRPGCEPLGPGAVGFEIIEHLRQSTVVHALVGGEAILGPHGPTRINTGQLAEARREVADSTNHGAPEPPGLATALDAAAVAHYAGWAPRDAHWGPRGGSPSDRVHEHGNEQP